jgi:hypothetical protein
MPPAGFAGGPRYVAGVSYFSPAVLGQPVVWQGGQVSYFVDQGPLGPVSNAQATAMVDGAAALWSHVPTAAVTLTDGGSLAEDVNGSDVVASSGTGGNALSFSAPSDVTPASAAAPIAVIFDSDGTVINALEGQGASTPTDCELNGVLVWIDNMNTNATLAHGVIVLNGLCATSPNLLAMMSYQMQRAFGQLLGLDFSQVNDSALNMAGNATNAALAWPVMQPISRECGASGGSCIPSPGMLRPDDVAALNRLYPVTAGNLAAFPGKVLTASNTVSIQGTIAFPDGQGMQGVNVVARPLDSNGSPLYQYTVTFVSGAYFGGNHGNPVTGWTDSYGNRLDRFGSNEASLAGFFDLSGIALPPGMASANYQVSFEAVNPLYVDSTSVGPYLLGSPTPYGVLATVEVPGMAAGGAQTLTVEATNPNGTVVGHAPRKPITLAMPAKHGVTPELGLEARPDPLPETGMWTGRLATVGQSDWLIFPVRGNRIFTIVTQAYDPLTGAPSTSKAMPAIGVWDGFDPIETAASGFAQAQNGTAPGETWLQVASAASDIVRLGITDQRGDGRPDYLYQAWVLYADTVAPERLPATGGTITIHGRGFRAGDTVLVGGVAAQVVEILPTEITAIVPAAARGVSGSQDVTVNDLAGFNALATIPGGVSYDSATGDAVSLVTAPMNQVPLNVPQAFTVFAEDANGNPAGGVTVTYSVTMGAATLGCGQTTCSVTTTGDGRATLKIAATNPSVAAVTAALTNGASVQTQFYGGTPAALTAITPTLSIAAGATIAWPVQAIAQSGNSPAAGQNVTFESATGIAAPAAAVSTNASGIAGAKLTVGPLAEGQSASASVCFTGTSSCAAFNVFGSRPEFASLTAVSGTGQSLQVGTTPAAVVIRVLDMDGNPMAGATVTVSQALYAWTPPCPTHGRCAQAQLLATKSTTLVSALDGSVTLTPLTQSGVATTLQGVAATGNSATLKFSIEQHP